jgi:nucleotide-binding universal stress UspA family protein
MMRILVAVNDSPAGLAAARAAVRLARETGGSLRAVYVRELAGVAGRAAAEDFARQVPVPVLNYVTDLAGRAGVVVEALTISGQPARCILDQAAAWPADLIVLGRSGVRHVGQPFVGSQLLHVLEFASVPIVVVPTQD